MCSSDLDDTDASPVRRDSSEDPNEGVGLDWWTVLRVESGLAHDDATGRCNGHSGAWTRTGAQAVPGGLRNRRANDRDVVPAFRSVRCLAIAKADYSGMSKAA